MTLFIAGGTLLRADQRPANGTTQLERPPVYALLTHCLLTR
jgi:hypothetical protein